MKKSVSVGIPVYNVEKYIEHCLKSLFEQSIASQIEFIIVDDCSPDNSMTVVDSVCKKHPELDINIFHHKKNMGLAAARNTILDNSSCDYIVFVDSDDWASPNYIEKLYKCAIENASDIVICSTYRTKYNSLETDDKIKKPLSIRRAKKCANSNEYISALLRENKNASMWCKLIKRSLIESNSIRWTEKNDMGEDTIITTKLFYYAHNIQVVQEPLYYHFFNISSLTNSSYDKKGSELFKACKEIESFLSTLPETENKIFYEDILYLKLRIKRQVLEKVRDRKKYYKIYPETDSVVWKAYWIAFHMRLAIFLGMRSRFLTEIIFAMRSFKRLFKKDKAN